ncbi:MAG: biopolymer transporter ExbD [Cyclobacteriaceae bacterium]
MARNKDRGTPEVSSGSMADIAFLLLIFFLVTTTIANDKGIAIQLPPKPDPNDPPPEVKFQQRNIFKILANSKDQLLVEDEPYRQPIGDLKDIVKDFILNFGNPTTDGVDLYNTLPSSMKAKAKQNPDSSDDPTKAIVSFKANRGTSYEVYIEVLDAVNAAYNEIYGERVGLTAEEWLAIDLKDDTQRRIYQQARSKIPRAISIAEPDK